MKMKYNIFIALVALFTTIACEQGSVVEFNTDCDTIEVEAVGGVEKVQVVSSDEWVASVEVGAPWIAISPANGRGSAVCDFVIDSTLVTQSRSAKVTIKNLATNAERKITVTQKGFDYAVRVDNDKVKVKRIDEYDKRYFDVVVSSNFDFDIEIPESAKHWLSHDSYKLNLNRGVRPREVKVRFNWKINNSAEERLADVRFVPQDNKTVAYSDILSVRQDAAEPIIPDTRAGDSLALLNITNTMQCWTQYDTSTTMDSWSGVTLWSERMEGCKPEWIGRVKRLELFLCNSFEGLPYEIQYLTAAEEIFIFSNENAFLKSLNIGEHICKLGGEDGGNLKRLTVGAFGLTELHPDFVKLKNLEYLDLGSNNFQRVPEILTKENFPRLRALVLNAQQRQVVSDLSNTTHDMEQIGGLYGEEKFPEHLLTWGLDTLVLSINYLHGKLPSFEDDANIRRWTQADIDAANAIVPDSLPSDLLGVPMIMPTTKTFRINGNRLIGEAPRWLLMHPALDWWMPFALVFPQEGRDAEGNKAGFTNAPASLVEYYTKWYPNKKMANSIYEDTTTDEDSGTITK